MGLTTTANTASRLLSMLRQVTWSRSIRRTLSLSPPALSNLTALTWLDLGTNQAWHTGTISPAFTKLTAVLGLSLHQLTGTIPLALGNLTTLQCSARPGTGLPSLST